MAKNICLITIDSLRQDHLGCYGYKRKTSPNIDKIAKNGIIFENAFTTNTATLGSFFSIFTSKYPLMGLTKSKPIDKINYSFVEKLKEKGYNTAGFNSNPYLLKNKGFNRGFRTFFDILDSDIGSTSNKESNNIKNRMRNSIKNKKNIKKVIKFALKPFMKRRLGYLDAHVINQNVFDWLDKNKDDNFFLWIHYMDVHMPYIPDKVYLKKVGFNHSISDKKMWKLRDILYNFEETKTITKEIVDALIALYDAEIRYTDEAIGEIIQKFKTMGLLDNLLILITADHGEEFLEHGGLGHSANLYDEVMKVPFIVYEKGQPKNKRVNTLISHIDIAPTIMNSLHKSTNNFAGENIFKYLSDEDLSRYVIAEDLHLKKCKKPRVIRTKNMKYIFDEMKGTHNLYNLIKDPKEKTNLANNEKDIPEKLSNILKKHIQIESTIKKRNEKEKIASIIRKQGLKLK